MLSIVIPYYKIAFFEETLKSLATQTDKRFTVYIGDDASPENPTLILEKFKGKFDFTYYRFPENLGKLSLTKQWERCIDLARNEKWVKILGDDDVLSNNTVKCFYENLEEIEKNYINVVRFATQKINAQGSSISQILKHPIIENASNFLFKKTGSSLSEYIFNKAQVESVKFKNFPLGWYSDMLAVFEFSNFGDIYSINESITYVRVSQLSISGSSLGDKKKMQSEFEFYFYLLNNKSQHFSESQIDEILKRINKCYLNNKKQYSFFFRISGIYFQRKLLYKYFLFLKAILFFTIHNRKKN